MLLSWSALEPGMLLSRSALEPGMYAELVGRAQMTNTDDIQEAPGSLFLARPLHSKKRSNSSAPVMANSMIVRIGFAIKWAFELLQ